MYRLGTTAQWRHLLTPFSSRMPLKQLASHPAIRTHGHWVLGGVVVSLTIMAGIIVPNWANATWQESTSVTTMPLALPEPSFPNTLAAGIDALGDANEDWRIVAVQPGQTLSDVFQGLGLGMTELQRALDSQHDASSLRRLRPGDEFAFSVSPDGKLLAMRFDRGEAERVTLHFEGNAIREDVIDRTVERRVEVAHGTVNSSLFEAGDQAGMSDAMTLKLANAFGYDIDFAQDLRKGDSFSVIYDNVYRDGERLRSGEILAATFFNQGKRYTAIRFTNAAGETLYYTEDGRPLRKSFLRTPVEFTRISSVFSAGRMHPILGKMRAHRGVDYAAPTGTPIRAAGAGTVQFRGWQNGYGNVVILQHDGKYTTLYGHLSRFAKINVGQRVAQGQTLGFVGMTGLASGPHLHYEFRLGGVHRDPLTVTLPPPEPLPAAQLAQFRKQSAPMLAKLDMVSETRLASTSQGASKRARGG